MSYSGYYSSINSLKTDIKLCYHTILICISLIQEWWVVCHDKTPSPSVIESLAKSLKQIFTNILHGSWKPNNLPRGWQCCVIPKKKNIVTSWFPSRQLGLRWRILAVLEQRSHVIHSLPSLIGIPNYVCQNRANDPSWLNLNVNYQLRMLSVPKVYLKAPVLMSKHLVRHRRSNTNKRDVYL